MNKITIIGNLTRDPETRSTTTGATVCSFTVAVNRRSRKDNQPDADFFKVSAWNKLGENCGKYLSKGRKVCVVGSISVKTYKTQSGEFRATMEIDAEDVEFLTKAEGTERVDSESGYTVADTDLPWQEK